MKKRTKILLSLLFGVILLFHLAWAGNYFLNYRPYTKTVPMHESGEYFLMTDNYDLSVAMPIQSSLGIYRLQIKTMIYPLLFGHQSALHLKSDFKF